VIVYSGTYNKHVVLI